MELRHWARQCLLAIAMLLALSGFLPALAQSDDLATLNRKIGQLYQAGKYDEAIPLAERLVELTGTRFGEEGQAHANALGVLGDLYREKGRYAEAEPLYQRARSKLEKALGPNHREVLSLRYLDALSVPEVAELLGRTVHATEALLVRARGAFRRAYEAGGDDAD